MATLSNLKYQDWFKYFGNIALNLIVQLYQEESANERATLLIFNRPGVAGAVLQTPLYLIKYYIQLIIICENIFKTLYIPNCKSQGAEMLRECLPPCVICQVSGITI